MSKLPSGTYLIRSVLDRVALGVDGNPPAVRVVTDPGMFIIQELADGKYTIQVPRFSGFLCPNEYIAPTCDEPYGWTISPVGDKAYMIATSDPILAWALPSSNVGTPITLDRVLPTLAQEWYFIPCVGPE